MIDAVLAYIVEDTTIANSIIEEVDNAKLGFSIKRYPVLGNSFWNELSDWNIDSKNVFIICSKLFGQKYEFELKKHVFKKKPGKYNFILITPADESKDEFISRMIQYSSALNISVLQFSNTNPNTKIIDFMYAFQTIKKREYKTEPINSTRTVFILNIIMLVLWSIGMVEVFFIIIFPMRMAADTFDIFIVVLLWLLLACMPAIQFRIHRRKSQRGRENIHYKNKFQKYYKK